jgi:hypothetical protein
MEIAVKSGASTQAAGDEAVPIYALIELFFFAYRDFVGDADRLLETYAPIIAFCISSAASQASRSPNSSTF